MKTSHESVVAEEEGIVVSGAWLKQHETLGLILYRPSNCTKAQEKQLLARHCPPFDDRQNLNWDVVGCKLLGEPQSKYKFKIGYSVY